MLSKVRHFVNFCTIKSIYDAIFEFHSTYSSTVWTQNAKSIKKLLILRMKSLGIIHFLKRSTHKSNFFRYLNIMKLPDKVSLEKCILICKYFNQSLLKSFKSWFTLATTSHTHNTRWYSSSCLKIPSHKTKIYGRHSINISAIYTQNYLQKLYVNILFYQIPLTKLKSLIEKFYTSNYN